MAAGLDDVLGDDDGAGGSAFAGLDAGLGAAFGDASSSAIINAEVQALKQAWINERVRFVFELLWERRH